MAKTNSTAVLPLPSLVRASAWDAGNQSMRAAGRTAWSREDFNAAARTQKDLVLKCFGVGNRKAKDAYPHACIRFSYAEALERSGYFNLKMKAKDFFGLIDEYERQYTAFVEQQTA